MVMYPWEAAGPTSPMVVPDADHTGSHWLPAS